MTIAKENKHEIRTRETRALLLSAAETIFVRDGYEGAELGEVAALAGRTKGAIYAHFKSKEDIFLALIEDRANCARTQMATALAHSAGVDGNIAALRNFYLQRTDDQAWSILLLEFKLFAMRHPESKKQLQEMYDRVLSTSREERYVGFLGPVAEGKHGISRVVAIQALQPMISGLIVEAQLDTALFNKNVLRKIVGKVFDAMLGVPPK
jgi:AcrR family transcriptional regulator